MRSEARVRSLTGRLPAGAGPATSQSWAITIELPSPGHGFSAEPVRGTPSRIQDVGVGGDWRAVAGDAPGDRDQASSERFAPGAEVIAMKPPAVAAFTLCDAHGIPNCRRQEPRLGRINEIEGGKIL